MTAFDPKRTFHSGSHSHGIGNLMILALASGALWGILIGTGCALHINLVLDRVGHSDR